MVENISEIDTNDQFIDTHQELSFDESIYETANKYPEKLTAQLANFHDVFSEGTRLLIDGFLNADDRKVENLKEVVYAMFKDNYMLNFEGDIESFIVKRKEVEELAVTLAESSNYNMQFSKFTRLTIDYAYKMFEGNKHNSPLMNIVEDSLNVEYSNLLNFAKSHLQENELNPDNFYLRAGRAGEVVSGRILHSDENYVSIVKAMFSQDDHITVVSRSELPDKLPPQQELISFVVSGALNDIVADAVEALADAAEGNLEASIADSAVIADEQAVSVAAANETAEAVVSDIMNDVIADVVEALADAAQGNLEASIADSAVIADGQAVSVAAANETAEAVVSDIMNDAIADALAAGSGNLEVSEVSSVDRAPVEDERAASLAEVTDAEAAIDLNDAAIIDYDYLFNLVRDGRDNVEAVRSGIDGITPSSLVEASIAGEQAVSMAAGSVNLEVSEVSSVDRAPVEDERAASLAAVKEAEVVSDRNGAVIAEYLGDLAGEGRSSQPDVIRTWFMEGLTSREKPSLIDNEEAERASVPSQYIFDESYLLSIHNDLFEGYNNLYLNDADKNTEILLKLHNILEPLRECDGLVPSIDKFCEVSSQIMTRMHFYAPFDNNDDNNKVVEAFITKLGAVHELNVDFSRIQKERTDYASNCARTSVFNSSYRQIVWDACSPERLKALDMAKEAIINSNINVTPIIRTAYPYEKITGDIVRYDDSIVCIRPSNGSIGNNSDHIIVVDRRNLPEGQLNLNEKVFFTANLDFSYLKDSESEVQSSRPFSRKQNVPNQDYAFSDNNGKEVLFSKRNYTNAKEFQENISYYTDNSMKFNAAALSSNDFKFSAPYLKFLHHSLYSDIFDWAGHIRTEEVISRGGSLKVDMSLDSGSLAHDLDVALAPLSDPDKLRNLSTLELAKVMSKSIENVDYIKPFHHGNLEAMQLFCTKVAAACGKDLNLKYITPSALKYALQVSLLDCDSSVLQDLIYSAMDEQSKERMDLSKNALQDAGVNYSSDTVILTPRVGSEVTGKLIRTYDHFAFIENIESGITKISVVDLTDFMKTGCSSDEYLRFTVSNDINRDYISYYTDDIDNHSVQNGQFDSNGANVLRNKFNYKEQSLLSESISRNTIVPAEILSEISNKHDVSDVNLLKEIHSVMYGDIYAWAGHTRNETVDIDGVRLSTMHNKMVFNNNDNLHNRLSTHSENIMNELNKALEPLKDINSLKKLDNNQFAARLGSVLAKCNRIQPFADGNMQALMEFAMVVGEKCNRPFDFDCSASELSDGLRRAQFIEEYKNEESFVVGQPTILEKEVAAESILDGIWRLSGPSVVSGRANSRALHYNAARLPEAKVSEPVLAHSQQPQANFIPSFVANQNFQNPINPCSGSRPDINDDFNKATSFLKNNASDYDNNIDFSKSISMNKQLSFDNNIKICTYVR